MVFKTCKVNRTIRGESVISTGQGKMSHEQYTVYEIRGNAQGRLGDGETTEESGHILEEGRIKEGRATWPT